MNIELWGFRPENCVELERLLRAEITGDDDPASGEEVFVNHFAKGIISNHWNAFPFIRVYSDKVGDFRKVKKAIENLLPIHGRAFQRSEVPLVVECVKLDQCHEL